MKQVEVTYSEIADAINHLLENKHDDLDIFDLLEIMEYNVQQTIIINGKIVE
ncbi:hypothetical protein [Macrococcoides caseolyticum]|uniref:hypothetical protein n=1 Tax=Macrococcoides caseolyticum TaxID=69966 RepID=UPI0012FE8B80|nr:hypothetical protein [Macrococcus caseolyticus]